MEAKPQKENLNDTNVRLSVLENNVDIVTQKVDKLETRYGTAGQSSTTSGYASAGYAVTGGFCLTQQLAIFVGCEVGGVINNHLEIILSPITKTSKPDV